jgi:hypothetical protein
VSSPREGGRIERLASELTRLARESPERLAARVAALGVREQAELALRLPAAQRLELLLHAPRPLRLVRALPDLELYLTLREVGPIDGLPLVALASAEQILHLIDLESWRGDRFDAARSGAWVALLLDAGEPALRRFLRNADEDLLALLVQQWMRVREIESDEPADIHGTGETETGDERGIVAPDGHHRFAPLIAEHAPAVARIAQVLYRELPRRYSEALLAALRTLPSELEEHALRWRQSRLEEHGFPPPEEAFAVYAAPAGGGPHPAPLPPADADGLTTPVAPLRLLDDRSPLLAAMHRLSDASREQVLHELLSLANKLLVADGEDTGDPEAHRRALEKGAGYVAIALEARGLDDPARAGTALAEMTVLDLFREGHAKATDLRRRARERIASGWGAAHPQAMDLLDSPIRERVRSLLAPSPLYLDIGEDGDASVRGFRSLDEIEEIRVSVETARVVGELLVERLGLDVGRFVARGGGAGAARFSTLLLTMLAWHATRGETRADPLPKDVAADFLRAVASRRTAAADAPARALHALVADLGQRFDLPPSEQAMVAAYGRACLERLAAECAALDPGVPLDRRAVSCLVVEADG